MSVNEIQSLINSLHYWDARVTQLKCDYFADEIELTYKDDDTIIIYRFLGCYKAVFDHVKNYDKLRPTKNMSLAQLPYFLQDVDVGEIAEQDIYFYTCKISMFPLNLEIWCKEIKIISDKTQ